MDKLAGDFANGTLRFTSRQGIQFHGVLKGHLKAGQFVTKVRKSFTKGEMDEDLLIVPAKVGDAEDKSEYTEVLPTSPP